MSRRFIAAVATLPFLVGHANAQRPCEVRRAPSVSENVGRLMWSDCPAGQLEEFSFPAAARVFPFRISVLKDGYTGPYSKTTVKVDVVWIDDAIEINAPLRSYGGDVILFANTIRVNAPIDTRVYFYHDVNHFAPGPPMGPIALKPGEAFSAENAIQHDDMDKPYTAAYKDYYEHCFDCDHTHARIAQLPSGLIAGLPQPGQKPLLQSVNDGLLPPDGFVDFAAVRSGNIYIFAKEITVNPALDHPFLPEDLAECNRTSTAYVPIAINASGITGGSGGAGSPPPCVGKIVPGRISATADCLSAPGGHNAGGGQGGDGGDIVIHYVDKAKSLVHGENLKGLVSVAGGPPGPSANLITPSSLGPHLVDGTRCSFVRAGDWPAGNPGKPGKLTIDTLESTTAIELITSLLAAKDTRMDYDFRVILYQAALDTALSSTTVSSALTYFLARQLVQSQSSLLVALDSAFVLHQKVTGSQITPILEGLDMTRLKYLPLPEPQITLLNQLSYFGGSNGIDDYFLKIGGAFNIDTKQQFDRFLKKATLDEIATSNTILAEIKADLSEINSQLFEQVAKADRREFQSQVSQLQQSITEAERQAEEESRKRSGLLSFVPILKDLGEAVSSAVTLIIEEDYLGAAASLGKVGQAFTNLATVSSTSDVQNIATLKTQLEAVQARYQAFSAYVQDVRTAYFARMAKDLGRVLEARGNLRQAQIANSLYVHDLIRGILASYMVDTAKDQAILSSNFRALRTYVRLSPREYPLLTLKDLTDWSCQQMPTDCITVQASTVSRELIGSIGGREVPLYVFGPTPASVTKPLFGVPQTSVREKALPASTRQRKASSSPTPKKGAGNKKKQ